MYLLSITNDSQLLDLVAYSGYKFVGIIVTMLAAEILTPGRGTGGWVGWTVFTYTFLANAFFLVSLISPVSAVTPNILINLSLLNAPDIYAAPLSEIRPPARLD